MTDFPEVPIYNGTPDSVKINSNSTFIVVLSLPFMKWTLRRYSTTTVNQIQYPGMVKGSSTTEKLTARND